MVPPSSWLVIANYPVPADSADFNVTFWAPLCFSHKITIQPKISKSILDHAMEESSPGSATTTDSSDSPSNPATSQRGVSLSNRLSPTEAPEPLNSRKSNTRYSGFNPDLIGTPSTPPGTDRFIFVNAHESSIPSQRQRVDQKAINAHVQTTAYLQRRSAAIERLKRNVKANVGRPRPARVSQSEAGGSYSQNSTLAAAISIRGVVSPRGGTNIRRRQGSIERRIIGHGNVVTPRADEDIDSEDEDEAGVELQAMRKVLESISQRMSSLENSRMLQGSPQSYLDSGGVDPFAIASVPITKGMNKVFSHCMSNCLIRTEYCHSVQEANLGRLVQVII